jgi:hypothetical protein
MRSKATARDATRGSQRACDYATIRRAQEELYGHGDLACRFFATVMENFDFGPNFFEWTLEYEALAFLVDLHSGIMGLTAGHITVVPQQ